jgi:hypothetical protein
LCTNVNINCVKWYELSVLTDKILQYLSLFQLIVHCKCDKNVTEQWYRTNRSQIQYLYTLQKSVLCRKMLTNSLAHLKKLTIEKAEKYCWDQLNDCVGCCAFSSSGPTFSCMGVTAVETFLHIRNLRCWLASRFCRKAMLPSVPSVG